ncbi:hypothetical protein [Archaeoglobus sp.]
MKNLPYISSRLLEDLEIQLKNLEKNLNLENQGISAVIPFLQKLSELLTGYT